MPEMKTIYHKKDGPADMWAIDADTACRRHPDEWRSEPWPPVKASDADEVPKQQPPSSTPATGSLPFEPAKSGATS